MMEVWFQHSNECNLLHMTAGHISCHQRMYTVTYHEGFVKNLPVLPWRICSGHASLFICSYAKPQRQNMAATLWGFHAEYWLWHSDWLKLLGWLTTWKPLCTRRPLLSVHLTALPSEWLTQVLILPPVITTVQAMRGRNVAQLVAHQFQHAAGTSSQSSFSADSLIMFTTAPMCNRMH